MNLQEFADEVIDDMTKDPEADMEAKAEEMEK